MAKLFMILTLLFLLGCSEFQWYTFSLRNEQGEALILPHNSIIALAMPRKDANTVLSPENFKENRIIIQQTKTDCAHARENYLPEQQEALNNINIENKASIRKITITMPYHANATDTFTRIPDTFCLGFYTLKGWEWDYTPIHPQLDEDEQRGIATVEVQQEKVGAIAILVDTTTVIDTIMIEAKP